jgi:hypothetical protein
MKIGCPIYHTASKRFLAFGYFHFLMAKNGLFCEDQKYVAKIECPNL